MAALLLAFSAAAGCAAADGDGDGELPIAFSGERVVSAELLVTQDKGVVEALARAAGAEMTGRYDVALYQLVYRTVDAHGEPTTASGALLIPVDQLAPLPLASYQHGTEVAKRDAPSKGGPEQLLGSAWATSGYVVALPDYLGLGEGPGLHPYIHAKSEATAVVDMLRAAYELLDAADVDLTDELFLFGYSQGGHATMAALREIEVNHADELTITAAAPMAGPYDLTGTMLPPMLDPDHEYAHPNQLAYILMAYNEVYEFFPTSAEMFAEPYDELIPPLFDGEHTSSDVRAVMPNIPVLALADPLVDGLSDPNHPVMAALRENDVPGDHPDYDWKPKAPIRLYHCTGDDQVSFKNAEVALEILQKRGAQIELIEPEDGKGGDHAACVIPSVMDALRWFDTLRGATPS